MTSEKSATLEVGPVTIYFPANTFSHAKVECFTLPKPSVWESLEPIAPVFAVKVTNLEDGEEIKINNPYEIKVSIGEGVSRTNTHVLEGGETYLLPDDAAQIYDKTTVRIVADVISGVFALVDAGAKQRTNGTGGESNEESGSTEGDNSSANTGGNPTSNLTSADFEYFYEPATGAETTRKFTVPANATMLTIKVWGAGGGGGSSSTNQSAGGGGAFAMKQDLAVTPGDTLQIVVGKGGRHDSQFASGQFEGLGGAAGEGPDNSAWKSGSGGGFSGVFYKSAPVVIAAGGGGASGDHNGRPGTSQIGSQLTPPQNGENTNSESCPPGGGGGGGFPSGIAGAVLSEGPCTPQDRAGEGGASYGPVVQAGIDSVTGNQTDPDYILGIGQGGEGLIDGGHGMVLIYVVDGVP